MSFTVGDYTTRNGKPAKVLFIDGQLYGVIQINIPATKWGAVRWSMEGWIYPKGDRPKEDPPEHAHDLVMIEVRP